MTNVVHFKSPTNTKNYLKKTIVISVNQSQNLQHFVGKTFFFLSDLNYSYNHNKNMAGLSLVAGSCSNISQLL